VPCTDEPLFSQESDRCSFLEPQGVIAIEIAKQIASGNVNVTPDYLIQGDGNLGGLLSAFLTNKISDSSKSQVPSLKKESKGVDDTHE